MEKDYEQSIFDEEQQPVTYAGLGDRFIALFLDGLVLSPLSIINAYSHNSSYSTAVVVMTALASIIYKPLMEYVYGATLGKKAMSIVVTNKVYKKPNVQEVLLRNIFRTTIKIVSVSFSFFALANTQFEAVGSHLGILQGLVGYSSIVVLLLVLIYIADIIVFLADDQNRALQDIIGKTYVIKK